MSGHHQDEAGTRGYDEPAATAVAAQGRGTEGPREARQDSLDYAQTD